MFNSIPSPIPQVDTDVNDKKPGPTKGERTRAHIYACALDLFAAHGYERTTMRMIAEQANVNLGLSYYYFPSKEHLVFEFYRNITNEFIERSNSSLESSRNLETRLIDVVETMFEVAAPYHAFAGSLFATAASPTSPLNPFSAPFTEVRNDGIALFERVIEGCSPRIPKDVAEELPLLLWTFNLGMMFSWIHDNSDHQETTRTILRQSIRLLVGLLRLSGLPGAKRFRRQGLTLLHLVRANLPTITGATS